MLQRLFESRSSVYLLLGVAAIVVGFLWLRTRNRRYGYGMAGIAALFALFFVINLTRSETDGEQIERKVKEMAAAVKAKNLDGAFQHVSDQFRRGGIDKPAMRGFAKNVVDRDELTDFQVSKFERVKFHRAAGNGPEIATITFRVKVITTDNVVPFRVECDFVRDPDGQWRVKDFRLYLLNRTDEYQVPGLD